MVQLTHQNIQANLLFKYASSGPTNTLFKIKLGPKMICFQPQNKYSCHKKLTNLIQNISSTEYYSPLKRKFYFIVV